MYERYFLTEVKKVFFSILLMLYGVSNIGATVQLHICCGDIVDWTVKEITTNGVQHKSCCGETASEPEDGCCEDAQFSIKLDEPQINITVDYLFNSSIDCAQKQYIDFSQYILCQSAVVEPIVYPQPPPTLSEQIGLFIYYKNLKLDC